MATNAVAGRREALQAGAALAVGAALGPWLEARPLAADEPQGGPPAPASLAQIALNRLAFGPRPGSFDFDTFAARPGATDADKLYNFIDWQLNPNFGDDAEYLSRRSAAGFATLDKSLAQLWTDHVIGATGANSSNIRNQPAREVRADTLLRAVYSQWQLYEVLVWFWHNHFSVYAWDSSIAPVWVHYNRDVIRANALGNFRVFLEAVAKSAAMLYYLDNATSQGAQFNENFARELCELHTLGAENYLGVVEDPQSIPRQPFSLPATPGYWTTGTTPPVELAVGYCDNDVYEVARCLTGWRVNDGTAGAPGNTGTFLYWSAWHDRANKLVLGKFFQADAGEQEDGWKALDLLAYHPGTARFICRKLCRRLIGDNPPGTLVDAAAQVFMDQRLAPDQIRQVVRFILQSPEFQTTWGEKIKTPAEAAIGLLRATRADYQPNASLEFATTNPIWSRYDAMGQPMFGRRSPDGYPDVKEAWSGTTSMLYRWRFCNDLVEDRIRTTINGSPALITSANLAAQTPAGLTTPSAIVDFWTARVFGPGYTLPAPVRTELLKMMSGSYPNDPNDNALTTQQINDRLKRMVALLLMGPDFQWR